MALSFAYCITINNRCAPACALEAAVTQRFHKLCLYSWPAQMLSKAMTSDVTNHDVSSQKSNAAAITAPTLADDNDSAIRKAILT